MGNENHWAGPRTQGSVDNHAVASSRPVKGAWNSQWVFHGDNMINASCLPVDVAETEVVGLFSSLAVKSVLDQDDEASAVFSEAHLLASDCYQFADSYAKRERSGASVDVPCDVDIVLRDESGEVCDPAVRQETGITSSGGNSSGGGQQPTGWGTPDRNAMCSPFSSSRTDQCYASYSGSEQWAAARSAVINYWPADYDHELSLRMTGIASAPVSWHAEEYDPELSPQARRERNGRAGPCGCRTRSLKTPTGFVRGAQKHNRGEHCQTCYERQMELRNLDKDMNTASPSKFKPSSLESRSRWFPKSQTVDRYGRTDNKGI